MSCYSDIEICLKRGGKCIHAMVCPACGKSHECKMGMLDDIDGYTGSCEFKEVS